MIRRIHLVAMCHGSQIRGKATTTRGGGSNGSSSAMAYRWVIADRIAHWGEVLADSNNKLQSAQQHLHGTIRDINNNNIIDDSYPVDEDGSWQALKGFALFCKDHMEAHPHILQRALTAAYSELKASTIQRPDDDVSRGKAGRISGDFSLRFATLWLIAALHSEYRLLSVEERRPYQPITGSTTPEQQGGDTTPTTLQDYQTQINVVDVDDPRDAHDLQSAYQRARVELERRHQDDLEGLVMYTLSKTQRLTQQHRPDLSHQSHQYNQGEEGDSDASSLSVMGIDLGDVVQYPPTGFASFQARRKSNVKSSPSTKRSENKKISNSRWADELAELLKDIPREWASLPHDTRTSWAPSTQRRRKLDEAAALHSADCERAQKIIDTSLRHFKKERKRKTAKTSNSKIVKATEKENGIGGGADHKEALQWLLSRRTT